MASGFTIKKVSCTPAEKPEAEEGRIVEGWWCGDDDADAGDDDGDDDDDEW